LISAEDREPGEVPGSTHRSLIEPLPSAVLLFAGDAPRSRATTCWRPVLRGSSLRLSSSLGHDLEPKIFWGHIVPGVLEPVPGSSTLIPMGGWCGISAPNTREDGRAAPHRARYCPCTNVRNQATPGGEGQGEVSGVDKGPSNGWHLSQAGVAKSGTPTL
jgi:hypothetical protein